MSREQLLIQWVENQRDVWYYLLINRALSLTVKQFSDKEQSDGSTPSERTLEPLFEEREISGSYVLQVSLFNTSSE